MSLKFLSLPTLSENHSSRIRYIFFFQEDQGAPLFLDGKFAGVMRQQESPSNPSLFENLYYEKEYFENLPQNPAKNKKPANKKKT